MSNDRSNDRRENISVQNHKLEIRSLNWHNLYIKVCMIYAYRSYVTTYNAWKPIYRDILIVTPFTYNIRRTVSIENITKIQYDLY